MTSDLLLKNARIPLYGGIVEGSIYIENGLIQSITRIPRQDASEVIDVEGRLVLPGGIDLHAHVYDPEYVENEDWETGSLAAAYGGITTLVDMPLRIHVDKVEVLERKISEARVKSYVNYGVTGGFVKRENIGSIRELRKRGVKTFKFFTCRPFKIEDEAIGLALREIRSNDAVGVFHAEEDGLINYWETVYRGRDDIVSYHSSRTSATEAAAILRIGMYALDIGVHVHIAHLSSRLGLESIKWLRQQGVKVTSEVCPHHLYFTREDSKIHGNYLKLAPTLKSREDVEALWNGLSSGWIEAYVSDNAPAPRNMKEVDVWSAWGGIPNLEIMGPFLYTHGVLGRRISIERFIDVFSRNPAKILGVYPYIGELNIGSRADLYILETKTPRKITGSSHHHKVDWTPWEGMEFYGFSHYLIVGGRIIIEKGELVGKPGSGLYIGELVIQKGGVE